MPQNSFKEHEQNNIEKFDRQKQNRVRANISSSTGMLRFIGSLVELYIPSFLNVFVKLTGGQGPKSSSVNNASQNTDRDIPKYPNTKDF